MSLNISLNGRNHKLNERIIEHLQLFYENKQYTVNVCQDQPENHITDILNNTQNSLPETLILRAYNRTQTKTQKIEKNEINIYNGSIIDDYQTIHDTKIPYRFVMQINRYTPIHDLYITLGEPIVEIPKKYNHHTITQTDNENKLFEEIVQTIFTNLPRCNWCGKLFKPSKKNYKYCSKKCSKYGWEENNRKNNREYYKRNKENMTEKQRNGLGSKNAYLSGTPENNPLLELEKVRKAKRSLGLKPIQ